MNSQVLTPSLEIMISLNTLYFPKPGEASQKAFNTFQRNKWRTLNYQNCFQMRQRDNTCPRGTRVYAYQLLRMTSGTRRTKVPQTRLTYDGGKKACYQNSVEKVLLLPWPQQKTSADAGGTRKGDKPHPHHLPWWKQSCISAFWVVTKTQSGTTSPKKVSERLDHSTPPGSVRTSKVQHRLPGSQTRKWITKAAAMDS